MSEQAYWMESLNYTDDVDSQYIRVLVYGPFGSGKTRFALTWPNPLVIDTDRGLLTGRKKHIPAIRIPAPQNRKDRSKVFQKVLDILQDAKSKSGPFAEGGQFAHVETIVLDGYTALADALLKESLIETGKDFTKEKPEYDHWHILGARLDAITQIAKELPYHFVATCGTKVEKDEQSGSWLGLPDIVGGYRNDIGYRYDEIWYMESRRSRGTDTSKGSLTYEMHTAKYRIFDAKTRLDLPNTIESPDWQNIEKIATEAGAL
jgi:hypothetical protein